MPSCSFFFFPPAKIFRPAPVLARSNVLSLHLASFFPFGYFFSFFLTPQPYCFSLFSPNPLGFPPPLCLIGSKPFAHMRDCVCMLFYTTFPLSIFLVHDITPLLSIVTLPKQQVRNPHGPFRVLLPKLAPPASPPSDPNWEVRTLRSSLKFAAQAE